MSLLSYLPGMSGSADLETSILKFLRTQTARAQRLKSICDELRLKLSNDGADNDAHAVPESAFKQLNLTDISAYFDSGVFDALELICKCNQESHKNADEALWHPARLCFNETDGGIRILVSSTTEIGDWQEFCVGMYA